MGCVLGKSARSSEDGKMKSDRMVEGTPIEKAKAKDMFSLDRVDSLFFDTHHDLWYVEGHIGTRLCKGQITRHAMDVYLFEGKRNESPYGRIICSFCGRHYPKEEPKCPSCGGW